ncbi:MULTISPECIES: Mov34/MPN/PAD-1 family protein [unclassified Bradyrhizobium]|uniref:Mov34/MPN/PAD-1 family protein n=1 Tax=unclassified Bradyrhizobium TaxID=2631580 RepID=UPI002916DE63|nr:MULTISPECIES: Mov34/MPN/PAD-1 family protein [unclassified Bradyrhizobium]
MSQREDVETAPWINPCQIVRPERRILDKVYQHAKDCYPDECCGFIRAGGEVHRATNDQNRLHAEDPVRWPRPARQAYRFADHDLLALNRSFQDSAPAVIIYHSHPDVGAYFSSTDAADAIYQGRPIYKVDYLVIDIRRALPVGAKLFRFFDGSFHCLWSETIKQATTTARQETQQ